jgi:hypothetical protein
VNSSGQPNKLENLKENKEHIIVSTQRLTVLTNRTIIQLSKGKRDTKTKT